MKQQKRNLLSGFDRVLLISGLALFGLGAFALINEPWIGRLVRGGDPTAVQMGDVKDVKPDARRRLGSELLWTGLVRQDALYDGDSLFVEATGELRARLTSGAEIVFGPGTLAKIMKGEGDGPALDLSSGNVVVKLAQGDKIKLQDTVITSANGAAELIASASSNDPMRIASLKGALNVTRGGQTVNLAEGGAALTTGTGIELDPDAIQLITPQPGAVYWPSPAQPILVSWKKPEADSTDAVELSLDASFTRFAGRFVTQKSEYKLPSSIAPGVYHIRISNLDGRFLKLSRTHHMFVNSLAPLALARPKQNSTFTLDPNSNDPFVDIRFEWEARPGVGTYQFQLSRTKDFTQLAMSVAAVENNSLSHTLNSAGSFFWRVRASSESPLKDKWSTIGTLKIIEGGKGLSDDGSGGGPLLAEPLIVREPGSRTPVTLAWKYASKSFQIEVSRSPTFESTLERLKVEQSSTTWTPPGEGNYFWRVKDAGAATTGKPEASWSSTGEIIFRSRAPLIVSSPEQHHDVRSPEGLRVAGPGLAVQWRMETPAAQYKVELAENREFNKGKREQTARGESTRFEVSKDGRYFVRVTAIGASKRQLSLSSDIFEIDYRRRLLLSAPVPTAPGNQVKIISFTSQSQPLMFRWKPTPHAKLYRLQISADADFASPIEKTSRTSSLPVTDIPPGKAYYWRLRAEYDQFFSDWSELKVLTVGDR